MSNESNFDAVGFALAKKDIKSLTLGVAPTKTIIFTATGITTVVPIGLSYNSSTDKLVVVDLYYGSVLTLGDHYSEANSNITLIGWNLAIGQKLEITVVTNAKL